MAVFFCGLRPFPSPVCDFAGDAQSLSARQVQSGYQNGQQRRASRVNPMHSWNLWRTAHKTPHLSPKKALSHEDSAFWVWSYEWALVSKATHSTWHETSTWMSGFRTHFRPFAGTALSRKSTFLHLLSVCGNWSTCFSTYNTAGWREAIVSTSSPLLNRFMIRVSTRIPLTWSVSWSLILVGHRSSYFLLEPVPTWLQCPNFYMRLSRPTHLVVPWQMKSIFITLFLLLPMPGYANIMRFSEVHTFL